MSEQYMDYLRDCLSAVGNIRIRSMMGGYLVYYREKLIGDICGNMLLVKRTPSSDSLLADRELRYPYEESKTLMRVIDDPENTELLRSLFDSMYEEFPQPKKKK